VTGRWLFTVRLCTCVCVAPPQNLLRHLNHDNLVRFYAACDKPPPDGQLCIVMELMKGSLASLLYGEWGEHSQPAPPN
jgi:serine/threonine protein kinase